MTPNKEITLWVGATRYYMGRMTYAVAEFCDLLKAEWPKLHDATKALIKRDVMEEIHRDDLARQRSAMTKPLGSNCARAAWDGVAELWEEKRLSKTC